ncbi:hypothetical protein Tco_0633206 [Tanacetum coccineum]
MIGRKVIRTLASVEIEIVLILGLPCCLSSSSVRCLESDVYPDAYLDGTDTESEPFEDPTNTETPEIAPPIPQYESTPPVFPILRKSARMVVRIPHAMSSGLSASMAEVAVMSESALRKRFWSSCESSPSVSPLDLPLRKRYHATSELVEGSEEDDKEEDEETEENIDSDSVSEDAEDEGPTAEDEDPVTKDEGLTAGVEGPGMNDEDYDLDDETHGRDDEGRGIDDEGHSVESDGLGLKEEEAIPGGQRQEAPVVGTTMILEDGMIYIDIHDYPPPAPPVQTPPSPEWTSDSLLISPSHSDVPSPILSPMIPLTVPSPIATVETEGFLTELGAQVEMQGGLIHDHAIRLEELSPALFKSLEYEQERVAVTFGAIWRPVLALEAWAGQTDAQRATLWHAVSDVQGENWDLRLQLADEIRARLKLAEVVDGMRIGQEPKGGA